MNKLQLEKLIYNKIDQFKELDETALQLSWEMRISPSVITNLRNDKTDVQNMRLNTLFKILDVLDERNNEQVVALNYNIKGGSTEMQ